MKLLSKYEAFIFMHGAVVSQLFFSTLRHSLDHTSPKLSALRNVENRFLGRAWDKKKEDCLKCGRDLVRLLSCHARSSVQLPAVVEIWKTVQGSHCVPLLAAPTPPALLKLVLPPKCEEWLVFMLKNVSPNNPQAHHHSWFHQTWLSGNANRHILGDVCRYVCSGMIEPPLTFPAHLFLRWLAGLSQLAVPLVVEASLFDWFCYCSERLEKSITEPEGRFLGNISPVALLLANIAEHEMFGLAARALLGCLKFISPVVEGLLPLSVRTTFSLLLESGFLSSAELRQVSVAAEKCLTEADAAVFRKLIPQEEEEEEEKPEAATEKKAALSMPLVQFGPTVPVPALLPLQQEAELVQQSLDCSVGAFEQLLVGIVFCGKRKVVCQYGDIVFRVISRECVGWNPDSGVPAMLQTFFRLLIDLLLLEPEWALSRWRKASEVVVEEPGLPSWSSPERQARISALRLNLLVVEEVINFEPSLDCSSIELSFAPSLRQQQAVKSLARELYSRLPQLRFWFWRWCLQENCDGAFFDAILFGGKAVLESNATLVSWLLKGLNGAAVVEQALVMRGSPGKPLLYAICTLLPWIHQRCSALRSTEALPQWLFWCCGVLKRLDHVPKIVDILRSCLRHRERWSKLCAVMTTARISWGIEPGRIFVTLFLDALQQEVEWHHRRQKTTPALLETGETVHVTLKLGRGFVPSPPSRFHILYLVERGVVPLLSASTRMPLLLVVLDRVKSLFPLWWVPKGGLTFNASSPPSSKLVKCLLMLLPASQSSRLACVAPVLALLESWTAARPGLVWFCDSLQQQQRRDGERPFWYSTTTQWYSQTVPPGSGPSPALLGETLQQTDRTLLGNLSAHCSEGSALRELLPKAPTPPVAAELPSPPAPALKKPSRQLKRKRENR